MSNSRYGLVVSCDDDIIRFRDPAKAGGPYFESKNFSEIKLAPGVSPHRFIGVQSPDGPPPKVCLPSCPEDRLPTMTIIKLNYIHSNERKWQRPVVESSTTHGSGPLPTFMTTDASGRIMEPRDGLLHPTSSWINITPRDVAERLLAAPKYLDSITSRRGTCYSPGGASEIPNRSHMAIIALGWRERASKKGVTGRVTHGLTLDSVIRAGCRIWTKRTVR
eukprot:COSAG01_NODE_387_length_17738_cov_14.410171_13_plen_220_part_00